MYKNEYIEKIEELKKQTFSHPEFYINGECENEEETINTGTQKLEEAVELLNEYNKPLEELAAEHGSEVEY